jgi:hypothetical protein
VTRVLATCLLVIIALAAGCQAPKPRTYAMGFNEFAPRFEIPLALKAIEIWSKHGDGATDLLDAPWKKLLDGRSAEDIVTSDVLPLISIYRAKGLVVGITVDPLNGLDRGKESKELVALGHSIAEAKVQQVFREYCLAVAKLAKPDFLCIGVETNLVHAGAPKAIYDALVKMDNDTARAIKAAAPGVKLNVSAQLETAWGFLPGAGKFVGAEDVFRDFPFIDVLGLSSYAYFAYPEPEKIPLDYFSRILNGRKMPVIFIEGGWPTRAATIPGMNPPGKASEEMQVRWVRRLGQLLDQCDARLCCPLIFADLDIDAMPELKNTILPVFASIGLTDKEFKAKPALAEWDKLRERPLSKRR